MNQKIATVGCILGDNSIESRTWAQCIGRINDFMPEKSSSEVDLPVISFAFHISGEIWGHDKRDIRYSFRQAKTKKQIFADFWIGKQTDETVLDDVIKHLCTSATTLASKADAKMIKIPDLDRLTQTFHEILMSDDMEKFRVAISK